jgi:hypothetical protein
MNILSSSLPRQRSLWRAMGTAAAARTPSVVPHYHQQQQVCCKSTAAMRTVSHRDTLSGVRNTTMTIPPAWFLHPHQQTAAAKPLLVKTKPRVTTSMHELIQQVPLIVKERKEKNIAPGSPDDPIIQLFR